MKPLPDYIHVYVCDNVKISHEYSLFAELEISLLSFTFKEIYVSEMSRHHLPLKIMFLQTHSTAE